MPDEPDPRPARASIPPDDTPTTAESVSSGDRHTVPEVIGPYRVLHELGRGGVGHVYLAEQERPVRRKVALKLILAGTASERILRRFESERQAMARLNHPHIAQIFDAGTDPTGIPYIAMEYVDGLPATAYAHRHQLDLAERLALFIQACEGVQHAHQKGILHRDIKPSNVLVTDVDGQPMSKIIDFGLAKAVDFALTDEPLHTRPDVAVGTLAYMAPEQLTGDAGGADTRSDVYALGVLLYQLLTGETPFDSTSLSRRSSPTQPTSFSDAVEVIAPKRNRYSGIIRNEFSRLPLLIPAAVQPATLDACPEEHYIPELACVRLRFKQGRGAWAVESQRLPSSVEARCQSKWCRC